VHNIVLVLFYVNKSHYFATRAVARQRRSETLLVAKGSRATDLIELASYGEQIEREPGPHRPERPPHQALLTQPHCGQTGRPARKRTFSECAW
jgi:hypothetical protein